jgi:nucleoside-diphosphate-sugar epimerase
MIEGYAGRMESQNDPTKARGELGWEPTVDVLEYIADFVRTHPRPAG